VREERSRGASAVGRYDVASGRSAGITREPGPGCERSCDEARWRPSSLPLRLRCSGSAFTHAGSLSGHPLVSLHPGASRCACSLDACANPRVLGVQCVGRQLSLSLVSYQRRHGRSPGPWTGGPAAFTGVFRYETDAPQALRYLPPIPYVDMGQRTSGGRSPHGGSARPRHPGSAGAPRGRVLTAAAGYELNAGSRAPQL